MSSERIVHCLECPTWMCEQMNLIKDINMYACSRVYWRQVPGPIKAAHVRAWNIKIRLVTIRRCQEVLHKNSDWMDNWHNSPILTGVSVDHVADLKMRYEAIFRVSIWGVHDGDPGGERGVIDYDQVVTLPIKPSHTRTQLLGPHNDSHRDSSGSESGAEEI